MALNIILIGKRIRTIRKKRGLSQETLSGEIGCSTVHLSNIESGIKCMSLDIFVKVANALNVSADELLLDNLSNNIKATNHEFANVLNDCNEYEKRVLSDVLTATKQSLRENRSFVKKKH
ncbi:MAG: helix-turn-helix domain-containing protein [Ruminococcus sp.]|nr:helix-turn-helix domain-containing protein [Ruminococcus sp.]